MEAAGIHWVTSRTGGTGAPHGLTAIGPSPFECHFWGLPHPWVGSAQQTLSLCLEEPALILECFGMCGICQSRALTVLEPGHCWNTASV